MKVVTERRALQWGAPGSNDYHGALNVDPGDDEWPPHTHRTRDNQ